MAVWIVRAGKHGEHEQKFLQEICDVLADEPSDRPSSAREFEGALRGLA